MIIGGCLCVWTVIRQPSGEAQEGAEGGGGGGGEIELGDVSLAGASGRRAVLDIERPDIRATAKTESLDVPPPTQRTTGGLSLEGPRFQVED